MNMSDDVAGAVIGISSQIAAKGVDKGLEVVDKVTQAIAKLLKTMFTALNKAKDNAVKSTKLSDLDSGEVAMKDLIADAKKSEDSIVSTPGLTKADVKHLTKEMKKLGLPIAFTNKDKDSITAHVRGSDKELFKRISDEMLKADIKARPQELSNFKAEKLWEIEGIQHELSKYDIPARWGKMKNGEYFCLFEKTDSKAALMVRGEFMRKYNEVTQSFSISKGDDGFYTLTDEKSGKIVTFDTVPHHSELAEQIQKEFGYDENKANIACRKFSDNLDGDAKLSFYSDNAKREFTGVIEYNIELKGESALVAEYDCLRLTPVADEVPRLVFRDGNNNFAVLNPEKMSRKQMAAVIRDSLGIKDEDTVKALVDKAEKVGIFYANENDKNLTHNYKFEGDSARQRDAFDVKTDIDRLNKDSFSVSSSATFYKDYQHGGDVLHHKESTRTLSFSDKKNAITELQQMYKSQGIPADTAEKMAREVFAKAKAQSAEKVLHIEEVKINKQSAETHDTAKNVAVEPVMTVKYGGLKKEVDITDRDKAVEEITETFDVSQEQARNTVDKAHEIVDDSEAEYWQSLKQEGYNYEEEESAAQTSENAAEKEIPKTNGHEKNPAETVEPTAPGIVVKPGGDAPDLSAPNLPAPQIPRRK